MRRGRLLHRWLIEKEAVVCAGGLWVSTWAGICVGSQSVHFRCVPNQCLRKGVLDLPIWRYRICVALRSWVSIRICIRTRMMPWKHLWSGGLDYGNVVRMCQLSSGIEVFWGQADARVHPLGLANFS